MKEIDGIAIVEIPEDTSETLIVTDVSGKEYKLSRFYPKPESSYSDDSWRPQTGSGIMFYFSSEKKLYYGVLEALTHKKILRAMFTKVFFVPRYSCLIALNSGWDAFSLNGKNLYSNLPPFSSAEELLERLSKDFKATGKFANLKETPVKEFAEEIFSVINVLTHENRLISVRKFLWMGCYGVTDVECEHAIIPALSFNKLIRIDVPHEAIVVGSHKDGFKAYSLDGEPLFKGSAMSSQRLNALLQDRSKDWPHPGWQY